MPPEALQAIDLYETKTGVPAGPGGKAARAAQYEQAAALYTAMDDAGREAFNRDKMIDIMGPEKAARYINIDEAPRELLDHTIARLENNDLLEGSLIEPSNSENHGVHLRIHLEALVEGVQQVESGEVELVEMTQQMYQLYLHAQNTYEIAVVPEMQEQEMQAYEQQLQQIGEYINNGIREIEKMQRDAEQEGEQSPQEGVGMDGQKEAQDIQIKAEQHMQKIQITQEAHEQKMALERQKALQDLAITDAKGAQAVQR